MHSYGSESTWQMNIIADLSMAQQAYKTLKLNDIDERSVTIDQTNLMFLEEVYN